MVLQTIMLIEPAPGANTQLRSHFLGALLQIGADQGHEHGTEGEGPCPRLLGQIAQVAAGTIDEGGALQDCGKNDSRVFRTKRLDGLLPGTGADPEPGAHQGGGGHQIAPRVDAVGRMFGNVGTSVEDHRQGEAALRAILLWLGLNLLLWFRDEARWSPLSFSKDQVQIQELGFGLNSVCAPHLGWHCRSF